MPINITFVHLKLVVVRLTGACTAIESQFEKAEIAWTGPIEAG